MSTRAPLVQGGHIRNPLRVPETFISKTLPEIYDNTIVVAATHPALSSSHATRDGWFLSDFYAFNYLLKGMGHPGDKDRNVPGQVWLTAADPRAVVTKWPDQQYLLHGNPYQTRRVVLSEPLLNANKYTPVTLVKTSNMIEEFLTAVRKASELAKREGAPLLLLVFCHGLINHQLLLDDGNHNKGLSIVRLKAAIEPGCRVTLVTTACYSGGWAIHPDLNHTTLTAAGLENTSNAWLPSASMGRTCGSIFCSTLIETLSSVSSPLLDNPAPGPAQDTESLQPDNPTQLQTESYNQFCRSILEVCGERVHRLWADQEFTFSAQDDDWEYSWTARTGIPLARFEERWNSLHKVTYTPPMGQSHPLVDPNPRNPAFDPSASLASLTGGSRDAQFPDTTESTRLRAVEMARLLLQACPGDWTQGQNVALAGKLRSFVKGEVILGASNLTCTEVLSVVRFRWESGRFADRIVDHFRLPRPGNTTCMFWDMSLWMQDVAGRVPDFKERRSKIWRVFREAGFVIMPTQEQGPPFYRFSDYIISAIIEAGKSHDAMMETTQQIVDYFRRAKETAQDQVYQVRRVRTLGRDWLKTVGRRIRRSLSPTKRPGNVVEQSDLARTGSTTSTGAHHRW
ncbi:hypothetical protein DTO166G4_7156 [Paecilomyces variotii]|uniref:Uncharacterized protein n=1 Tax=Byssochlamys spectabilis TaxID=264951 RepID=A0A443HTW3_BYSSP|nr:hypothetical protein C8Q69DRAFT_287000 [Paecilomyces variotii]KAJ9191770.1 hypothetical protein DTO164E3_8663 [Paecilomyces variotii]KAJ9191973.1 hypothetical protein DTO032I3_8537 [Paecilomyces variotii]KAJ9211233.1 hypothetical protein DTO166G4_7156 [Paecilomyces variotii]KAJ9241523.1 hypothetical protein DTO166G5_1144 [Paecilomyces variotii]KAJ9256404.1 hypothetical protein DTO212C5_9024 [Paecilomyces variotii]